MQTPIKACEGGLSDDLQAVLTRNREREQWAVHTCQVCGASVGVVQVGGKWVTEQHWPTVKYPPRDPGTNRYDRSTGIHVRAIPARSPLPVNSMVAS